MGDSIIRQAICRALPNIGT